MKEERKKERTIERSIELDASPETVWRAITDAEELMRWFPLDARSSPGAGGTVWWSWGPPYEGESKIEIWDPPRRLRLQDQWGGHPQDEDKTRRVAMDFELEGKGGKTILRLVHSGFGSGAEWDDEFDGTARGWRQELLGLKHYLERHAGTNRRAIWARTKSPRSREQVWQSLMGSSGLNLDGLQKGESFERTAANGDRLSGRVLDATPHEDFTAVLSNLNDAFFRMSIEKMSMPEPHCEPQLWLSTYGLSNAQVLALQVGWDKLLWRLFPEE